MTTSAAVGAVGDRDLGGGLLLWASTNGGTKVRIVVRGEDPTCGDLRRAVADSGVCGSLSTPIRMIALGKTIYNCYTTLSSLGIVENTVVFIQPRLGGNPCSRRIEDKNECDLFVVPVGTSVSDHKYVDWGLGDRPTCCLEYCDCDLRANPVFRTRVIGTRDSILWRVEQECYCLAQATFNKGNIAAWRMDGLIGPYRLESTTLQIKKATVGYDVPPRHGKSDRMDEFCFASLFPPPQGWDLHGVYEFRLNAPSPDDILKMPAPYFNITGFDGQRHPQTEYRHSLAVRFIASNHSKLEHIERLETSVPCLAHTLINLVTDYLFF